MATKEKDWSLVLAKELCRDSVCTEVALKAVENGACVDDFLYGSTLLATACCAGELEVVRAMISAGASPNKVGEDGVHCLAQAQFYEMVDELMRADVDWTYVGPSGLSLAQEVLEAGHYEVVERLAQMHGVDFFDVSCGDPKFMDFKDGVVHMRGGCSSRMHETLQDLYRAKLSREIHADIDGVMSGAVAVKTRKQGMGL